MPLKSELLNFLSRIPNIQTVRQRKALLAAVGFDRLGCQITWEGINLVFFNELLELLRSEGHISLEEFLRKLADRDLALVGLEDSQKLITFAERVCALTPDEWSQEFWGISNNDDGQIINLISKSQSNQPESVECPYKGLFAFKQEDAKFFFGREKFTATLIESVNNQPFLAIIGNSGMGKSSVVFAGLIPELEKLGKWRFIIFRPSNNPFSQIVQALVKSFKPTNNESRRSKIEQKYLNSFEKKELTLKSFLAQEIKQNSFQERFLIVIDQFEEIYTLSPENQKEIFINQLLEVVHTENQKKLADVVIVITLRVDFYGFALDYQPLAETLQKWKPETLIGMSREELQSAIEKPAEAVGLEIQDGLTKIILDDVISNPGELPLLEFALEELWKKQNNNQLTFDIYKKIGGVQKALAQYAESIHEELDQDEQQTVKHIFTQLVRFGEQTENTRRLATYSQIGSENWNLVTDLANDRLVVTGYDATQKQPTVEVVHEVLIRGWERLQQWMAEDQDFRKWQDRLRFEMKTWEETKRNNSALLRGALLVEAEDWLTQKSESIVDANEVAFIQASRQFQEQEDLERIKDLLNLSQKELQLRQQLSSLVIAVKAGIKLRNIQNSSDELKKNVIKRLQQGSYEISEQNQLIGHTKAIVDVAFSPDASMIASSSDDKTVKLWNLDGKLLKTFEGHTDEVWGVSFSPCGQMIASASLDRTVKLWSLDGTALRTLEHTDSVLKVSFSPDGEIIASASVDRTVKLWSLDGTVLRTLEGHTDQVYGVSFSPDGEIIASASVDKTVKLWSLDGTVLRTLEGHTDRVWGVSFSPDGEMIASASVDRTVKLWSLDGRVLHTFEGHTDRVNGVSFSPDGEMIASAGIDRTVRLWSLDGRVLRTLEGHTDPVLRVSFSPNGEMIASASLDRTVRLWSLEGRVLRTLEGHTDRVSEVSFSPNGEMIASASADKTVRLWSLDGRVLRTLEGHIDTVCGISFSPDGSMIASNSLGIDRTVRLWSLDGRVLRTLEGHTEPIYGVNFSPDGEMIASASADKTIRLWSLDGTLLRSFEGHTGIVFGVSFSPNGEIIASASADKTVRLWSLDGTLLRSFEGHTDPIYGINFSPDGEMIASASLDRTIKLWGVEGILLRTLEGHTDQVWGVSFSPNGEMIASASLDKTVRLWSLDGTLLRTFEGHTDRACGVSFSPNGKMIASAGIDRTVRLWIIEPEDLILDLDVKLNNLLKKGCHWIRDYLKTNPNASENDINLCDDYC
ncbi:MAG: hypothetical protein F6J92_03910 [Symploca sp. SIO1A3]|nr:hypothetical protein [Symploca sp. SIO1A3]